MLTTAAAPHLRLVAQAGGEALEDDLTEALGVDPLLVDVAQLEQRLCPKARPACVSLWPQIKTCLGPSASAEGSSPRYSLPRYSLRQPRGRACHPPLGVENYGPPLA